VAGIEARHAALETPRRAGRERDAESREEPGEGAAAELHGILAGERLGVDPELVARHPELEAGQQPAGGDGRLGEEMVEAAPAHGRGVGAGAPRVASVLLGGVLLLAALACGEAPPPAPSEGEVTASLARIAAEATAQGREVLEGPGGWLFLRDELHYLGAGRFWGGDAVRASRARKPAHADPLPAILAFRDLLRAAGVELLVVPVPAKAALLPGAVPGLVEGAARAGRLDAASAAFYALLEAQGVEVLDLQPLLAALPGEGHGYCRTDTHWCGPGLELAAARIAERVRRRDWYQAVAKQRFASERRALEIEGDLARKLAEVPVRREALTLRFVGRAGLPSAPVPPSRESPLVLVGDSLSLIFHEGGDLHARGAGLPDQLALELGFPVDLVAVRGSGETAARISLARRGELAGKKLVVWCFTARVFTESLAGWPTLDALASRRPGPR
jgi:acetyltransferase AlgX (SGNH hydrolase-like protein)